MSRKCACVPVNKHIAILPFCHAWIIYYRRSLSSRLPSLPPSHNPLSLLLQILCFVATNCILPTMIVGSGNTAVCAGDRLTFTCNASSNLTTQERWRGSSWGGDGNQVTLSVSDPRGTSTIRAIAFNVSLVSNSPYLMTKVEIAAATQDLNGTTVTCLETTNGASYVDVGTGCIIFAG